MTDLVAIFQQEVDVNLQEATALILELEKQGYQKPLIENLMRVFHTLKGVARAVQFDQERHVAHRMEDCFHAVLRQDRVYDDSLIELTLFVIDLFNALLQARLTQQAMPSTDSLDQRVEQFLQAKDALVETVPVEEQPEAMAQTEPGQIHKPMREAASVPYEQIDRLQNIGGELTVATSGFIEQRASLRKISSQLNTVMQHLSRLTASSRHDLISQQRLLDSLSGMFAELDSLSTDVDYLTESQENSDNAACRWP